MRRWAKLQAQIDELRRKHGGDRSRVRPFPDLSVEQNVAPVSNRIAGCTPKKPEMPVVKGLIVDTLHKQGMQVLSKSELPWAGGKKP